MNHSCDFALFHAKAKIFMGRGFLGFFSGWHRSCQFLVSLAQEEKMYNEFKYDFLKMFRRLLVFLVLGVFSSNLFSYFFLNDVDGGYANPGRPGIRLHQIKGAGDFLKSHAAFLLFLDKIECSEMEAPDYRELGDLLTDAVAYLESARDHYAVLQQIADMTPYDPVFLTRLAHFHGAGVQEMDRLADSPVKGVEAYLRSGDLRGINSMFVAHMQELLDGLIDIESSVDAGIFPEITPLLQLQRAYCQLQLRGQYAATVFMRVVGK
jgi:hypothetical protein